MAPPSNYTVIPTAQVAVRTWDQVLEDLAGRRILQQVDDSVDSQTEISEFVSEVDDDGPKYTKRPSGQVVWFADMEERYFERLKLLEALEIQIRPDDEDFGVFVQFEWDILGYDDNFIWLQLLFQNPWEVAADGQFDTIFVTFWGTEYFQSINGKEVRYGETI